MKKATRRMLDVMQHLEEVHKRERLETIIIALVILASLGLLGFLITLSLIK